MFRRMDILAQIQDMKYEQQSEMYYDALIDEIETIFGKTGNNE